MRSGLPPSLCCRQEGGSSGDEKRRMDLGPSSALVVSNVFRAPARELGACSTSEFLAVACGTCMIHIRTAFPTPVFLTHCLRPEPLGHSFGEVRFIHSNRELAGTLCKVASMNCSHSSRQVCSPSRSQDGMQPGSCQNWLFILMMSCGMNTAVYVNRCSKQATGLFQSFALGSGGKVNRNPSARFKAPCIYAGSGIRGCVYLDFLMKIFISHFSLGLKVAYRS